MKIIKTVPGACRQTTRLSLIAMIAVGLSGCALIHHEFEPLKEIDSQKIRLTDDIKLARDGWPQSQWWLRYADNQLNTLIDQALKDSPAVAVALARVMAAQAQISIADSNRGAVLEFEANVDRTNVSENGFLGPFAHTDPSTGRPGGPWYSGGTVGFLASYSFDLWGKDRARVDAAIGVRNALQAEGAQAELMISSRVTQVYYSIQTLYQSVALSEQTRDIETQMFVAHSERARRGIESYLQAEMVRTRKLALDMQIKEAYSKIATLREALRAVVGAGPDELPILKPMPLPLDKQGLPASLGYELLARRPDLQAMRWYVQASLREIDVARAAFYPSFSFKTFFGYNAVHLSDLFQNSSRQINLVPGLTLPIFDSGRLNAEYGSAGAQSNLRIAQYNQSVVNAVREVAEIAVELEDVDDQIGIQDAKLNSVTFSFDSAQAHYKQGLTDKVAVLEAKIPLLQEEEKVIELRNRRINAEVALVTALGGGYKRDINQSDISTEENRKH